MNTRIARRTEQLKRQKFPHGRFVALLTAALVTLIGVYLRLDSITILIRASVSATVIGTLISLGVSIVRLTEDENRKHNLGRGKLSS